MPWRRNSRYVRTQNFLQTEGANTLFEFVAKNYTRCDLLRFCNFGKKSIEWKLEQQNEKAGVEIE